MTVLLNQLKEMDSTSQKQNGDSSPAQLTEKIKNKTAVVGIVGLGYVGFPLSLVFAEAGVRAIGFDIDRAKIEKIEKGESYIKHIHEQRVRKAVHAAKFTATHDFRWISHCDAVIICVPTPLDSHWEPDLKYIRETCENIAPYLKPHALVSLESTTWPGTTEEVCRPILENHGRLKYKHNLYLCFSPEREDPGNASFNTRNIPKLVGADDPISLELATTLYKLALETVIPVGGSRVAESAKLVENIFRCVNIALVNELKIIFDKMGIDVWEVIKAANTKPFGFMPFWPGPGLGGHCIPIDPFYLTWKAKEFGINTRFIELAGEINRSMPHWVVQKVQDCLNAHRKALNGSKILILGLAYKENVDDMRESPSLELIRLLENKGAIVDYNDPYIRQIGPNREYPELIGRESHALSSHYDCMVVATKHHSYKAEEILAYGIPVVDTRHLMPKHELVTSA